MTIEAASSAGILLVHYEDESIEEALMRKCHDPELITEDTPILIFTLKHPSWERSQDGPSDDLL